MKKALITASVFGFIGSFEKSNIKILLEQGYEVHVATNMSKDLKAFGDTGQLEGIDVIKHQISYSRSPLSLQTIKSYKAIKKLIKEENFDLIHCHTPVVAMLTRLSARKSRKKGTKVIYTAHGFHFFKGAPLLNWLIYFPLEYFCSFFTDILITINQEDYRLAQKVMKAKQVEYVPGVGVDVENYRDIQVDKVKKRKELEIYESSIMLLSVGELSKRKNHEIIIDCLKSLRDFNIVYCIVGQGDLEEYLKNKVKVSGLENQVRFLGYRNDVIELYKSADFCVFPSLQEGLPVALMEAMMMGLPCIASDIRGNNDLIVNGINGYLVQKDDEVEYSKKILKLINDEELCNNMSIQNLKIIERYDIKKIRGYMEHVYSQI